MFPKILICPSETFSSNNVMELGQVFLSKLCFLLCNNSVVQTPITCFINQKEKHVSIWTLRKPGAPFFHIENNVHDLSWCEVFFSSLTQYLLWETCCKNINYQNYLYMNFLWTIISSLVNKNYQHIVSDGQIELILKHIYTLI